MCLKKVVFINIKLNLSKWKMEDFVYFYYIFIS